MRCTSVSVLGLFLLVPGCFDPEAPPPASGSEGETGSPDGGTTVGTLDSTTVDISTSTGRTSEVEPAEETGDPNVEMDDSSSGTSGGGMDTTTTTSGTTGDPEPKCGNGLLDPDEGCDPLVRPELECTRIGYVDGTAPCDAELCIYDTSECIETFCGNGIIDEGEECDPMAELPRDCESLLFDEGTLACTDECRLDDSGCSSFSCMDGTIQEANGEDCEPGLPLPETDCSAIAGNFDEGTLTCADNCRYDDSECVRYECGNGEPEPGEDCDFVGIRSCAELDGFDAGSYGCNGCELDTSECVDSCALNTVTWYVDCDGDGFAASEVGSQQDCAEPRGSQTGCGTASQSWTTQVPSGSNNIDCNDANPAIFPGATEPDVCNGVDDDCDGEVDGGITVPVNIELAGPGTGSVSYPNGISCPDTCSRSFACGEQVTLAARPDSSWLLGSWSGDCEGTNDSCSFQVDGPSSVTASFADDPETVRLTLTNSPTCGTITTDDGQRCSSSTCVLVYPQGTRVTLSRNGGDWTGRCSDTSTNVCTLTLPADRSVGVAYDQSDCD